MSLELNTTPDWRAVPGTRLEGIYELRELMSADGGSALFRTLLPGDAAPRGLARLVHLKANYAARQLELWRSLARIPHRNLQKIISSGETERGDKLLAFVITEGADEDLSTVLRERSLTTEEAGGVLLSATSALQQLHTAGFVHGRISPAEIFASGDEIKISADCVVRAGEEAFVRGGPPKYLAPEKRDQNNTPAADIWCFGACLYEALTQRGFSAARLEEARRLPAPFGRIIAACADPQPAARPQLTEILSLYEAKDAPLAAPDVPPLKNRPEPTHLNATAIQRPGTKRRAPLLMALAAVLVLAVVFAFWRTQNNAANRIAPAGPTSPDAKELTKQDAPAAAPAPLPQTTPPTAPPQTSAPDQAPTPGLKQEEGPKTSNGPVWRLVLWTYARRPDAQNKVDNLKVLYPELRPEVFTPNGDGGLYLVVVGGDEMTRNEAEDTRRKVRQLGLPRDAYIQNFVH